MGRERFASGRQVARGVGRPTVLVETMGAVEYQLVTRLEGTNDGDVLLIGRCAVMTRRKTGRGGQHVLPGGA